MNIEEILHPLGKSRVIKRAAKSEQLLVGIIDENQEIVMKQTYY